MFSRLNKSNSSNYKKTIYLNLGRAIWEHKTPSNLKINMLSQVPLVHACNSSYLGDNEDCHSKPT
jgi:hypothetical protein